MTKNIKKSTQKELDKILRKRSGIIYLNNDGSITIKKPKGNMDKVKIHTLKEILEG